ncbi:30S ribosomal protein S6 [Ophiocordyceps camponoti-floridani]|uniref:30S ribosomal protein S6 n=1 Tax=Ophiocordyceps camponoti-floridani TaxID=2030778 RepID=A0A8H4Q964_9HYPO|nr:30S ribosomal protein S6 [Ophiocordyceps camponoti-floridani]
MLYETIGIVRPGNVEEVKTIVKTVGTAILENGGVIRGLCNWGVYTLPKPISINQMQHAYGHHFVLRYDSSTSVHQKVRDILRSEPRMLRSGHVKLGDNTLPILSRFKAPTWRPQSARDP